MAEILRAMPKLIKWEGKYSNDPHDPGGETMWGITARTARGYGYNEPMKDMSIETAATIYKKWYWDKFLLDITESQGIAEQIFQAAVNQGADRWAKYVQKACNDLLSPREITVDGMIGSKTAAAINELSGINSKFEKELSAVLYTMQIDRYKEVIKNNPTLARYKNGWDNRASDYLLMAA